MNLNNANFSHKMINASNVMISNNFNRRETKTNFTPEEPKMISRLHQGFDVVEEIGGWIEIGGVLLASFTEGTSLALEPVGLWHSAVGTAGNIALDYYEGNYRMMTYRVTKFVLTVGIGKAINRIPGGEYILDKTILKVSTFVYDKLVSPSIQRNFIVINQKSKR